MSAPSGAGSHWIARRVRARTQSGGVRAGLLEAPRAPEPVSEVLRRAQPACAGRAPPHAPPPDAGRGILAAGRIVPVVHNILQHHKLNEAPPQTDEVYGATGERAIRSSAKPRSPRSMAYPRQHDSW